jgi:putative transposase
MAKKLRRYQRSVTRCKRGSNGHQRAKFKVAMWHNRIKNTRETTLHQITSKLIRDNGTIVVEDLQIKNMIKNHKLSKAIADASWGILIHQLIYKAGSAGRSIIKVDPKNTSQNCSGCGVIVKKDLATRVHKCDNCELEIDRDYNAAINIRDRAVVRPVVALKMGVTPLCHKSDLELISN